MALTQVTNREVERLMFRELGFAVITDTKGKNWIRYRDPKRKKRLASPEEMQLWDAAVNQTCELVQPI